MADPDRATRPLAVDATIVMLSPSKGEVWNCADLVVALALLVELTRTGRLTVSGSGERMKLTPRDTSPAGDELLDEAIQAVASRGDSSRVLKVIPLLPKTDQILDRLVAEGMATEHSERKLGIFTSQRHRPTPAADRDNLLDKVMDALRGATTPDAQTALLVSVLTIDRTLRAVFPREQRIEMVPRIDAIRESTGPDEAALATLFAKRIAAAQSSGRIAISG